MNYRNGWETNREEKYLAFCTDQSRSNIFLFFFTFFSTISEKVRPARCTEVLYKLFKLVNYRTSTSSKFGSENLPPWLNQNRATLPEVPSASNTNTSSTGCRRWSRRSASVLWRFGRTGILRRPGPKNASIRIQDIRPVIFIKILTKL